MISLKKTEQVFQLFPLTYEITFAQSIWYQDLSSLKITQITYTWHRIIFQICYKVVIKGFWLIFKILKVSPKLGMATIPTRSPRLAALWERPPLYSKVFPEPLLKCSSQGKSKIMLIFEGELNEEQSCHPKQWVYVCTILACCSTIPPGSKLKT